ncbi:MAG: hypothetical protein L6Q63_04060 [Giesbergeria sp.]|nr:hypothetical protein [Giesbergeria sp.]
MERKNVTLDDLERRHTANHLEPYWGWNRLVLSLSTGALTVLVSLQGHYVPKQPTCPQLLVGAWALLVVSIAAGLWALRWSYVGPLIAARNLRRLRRRAGDAGAVVILERGGGGATPPASHRWSVRLMSASFLCALLLLCAFAGLNVLALR